MRATFEVMILGVLVISGIAAFGFMLYLLGFIGYRRARVCRAAVICPCFAWLDLLAGKADYLSKGWMNRCCDMQGGRVIIMSGYCVVTADGIRARYFCLERTALPEGDGGHFLEEEPEALINTEADMSGRELYSDTKTGRNAGNGMAHGYDDNRKQHMEEIKRRFSKLSFDEDLILALRLKPKILVLSAEKHMFGYLRTAIH